MKRMLLLLHLYEETMGWQLPHLVAGTESHHLHLSTSQCDQGGDRRERHLEVSFSITVLESGFPGVNPMSYFPYDSLLPTNESINSILLF